MSLEPTPGSVRTVEGYGLADAPADGTALAWKTIAGWLTRARNYWVCSTRPDGRPHAIPVWGLWLDEVLWFSTDPRSYKARNLTANPEVVVHLESGDEVCVIEGTARRVAAEELPGSFVAEYQLKYEIELDLSNENFGFYLLAPRVALSWIEADFPTTATRWTFSP